MFKLLVLLSFAWAVVGGFTLLANEAERGVFKLTNPGDPQDLYASEVAEDQYGRQRCQGSEGAGDRGETPLDSEDMVLLGGGEEKDLRAMVTENWEPGEDQMAVLNDEVAEEDNRRPLEDAGEGVDVFVLGKDEPLSAAILSEVFKTPPTTSAFAYFGGSFDQSQSLRPLPPPSPQSPPEAVTQFPQNLTSPPLSQPALPLVTPPPPPVFQNVTSPPQNTTSPPQNVTSPPQNTTSPPQNVTSPPQNVTSPPQSTTSPPQYLILPPPQNLTPPPQNLTSPPQNLTSPPQNLTSPPQNLTPPPQNVISPPQNVISPPQNVTSPPQNVTSPPQNVTSPQQNVTSPQQNVTSPPQSVTSPPQNTITSTPQNTTTSLPQNLTSPSTPRHLTSPPSSIPPFFTFMSPQPKPPVESHSPDPTLNSYPLPLSFDSPNQTPDAWKGRGRERMGRGQVVGSCGTYQREGCERVQGYNRGVCGKCSEDENYQGRMEVSESSQTKDRSEEGVAEIANDACWRGGKTRGCSRETSGGCDACEGRQSQGEWMRDSDGALCDGQGIEKVNIADCGEKAALRCNIGTCRSNRQHSCGCTQTHARQHAENDATPCFSCASAYTSADGPSCDCPCHGSQHPHISQA